jgi:hypothetical protein
LRLYSAADLYSEIALRLRVAGIGFREAFGYGEAFFNPFDFCFCPPRLRSATHRFVKVNSQRLSFSQT